MMPAFFENTVLPIRYTNGIVNVDERAEKLLEIIFILPQSVVQSGF